jgi:hypothetical protein
MKPRSYNVRSYKFQTNHDDQGFRFQCSGVRQIAHRLEAGIPGCWKTWRLKSRAALYGCQKQEASSQGQGAELKTRSDLKWKK